jgi:hypothetical protein
MITLEYDNYMYFIAIVGNFSAYFQAYQIFKDRRSIKWSSPGSYSRILSYVWSIWVCISWIIWAALEVSNTVMISTVIALGGSMLCLIIITASSCINNSPNNAIRMKWDKITSEQEQVFDRVSLVA